MSTATLEPTPTVERPALARFAVVHWLVLAGMTAVYLVLFFIYFPCFYGIEDEVGYINQAVVWSRGSLSAEGAGFDNLFDFTTHNGQHVSYRHPGRSLLILPFLLLGSWRVAFVTGAVIHVLLTFGAALALSRLGRSPLWAVLVLCHPTLALHSRTLMADTAAALGVTLAFVALTTLRRPGTWAGAAIGLAAVMRYQTGIVLPFFSLAILATPHVLNRRREALACLIVGGAFGGVLVCYNYLAYGNAFGLYQGHGYFTLGAVLPNLTWFSAALLVIWPLMLLVPWVDRSPLRWAAELLSGLCSSWPSFGSTTTGTHPRLILSCWSSAS